MSAVFDAIGDVVGGVVDAVGDALDWVGDTVSDVVESVMDDPIKAVAKAAAIATGNAWALPIIEGVDVLAGGGDLDDALKAAAVTYVVQTGTNLAMDSFAAAGATADVGSGTTQFFDDGSSIQFFDDGSRLITDTAGKVTASAADDFLSAAAQTVGDGAIAASATDDLAVAANSPVAQTFPVADDVAGNALQSVDDVAAAGASPTYNTMEELLLDKGAITQQQYDDLITNVASTAPAVADDAALAAKGAYYPDTNTFVSTTLPDAAGKTYDTMEDLLFDKGAITQQQYEDIVGGASSGVASAADPYANLPDSIGNVVARDPNAPQYATMEDLLYDKGALTDAQYKDLTGVAPVVDKSIAFDPNVKDIPLTDALMNLGEAGWEYAEANPFKTAAVIGGGLSLMGAAGEQPAFTPPAEPGKKTYTYGAAPPISRTGLSQLYSATDNIYGPRGAVPVQGSTLPPNVQFQSSFQPLLGGAASGAARVGLGALGQGFSYTPMGSPQTFDISALTPEQIVQLQDAMARRRAAGGG